MGAELGKLSPLNHADFIKLSWILYRKENRRGKLYSFEGDARVVCWRSAPQGAFAGTRGTFKRGPDKRLFLPTVPSLSTSCWPSPHRPHSSENRANANECLHVEFVSQCSELHLPLVTRYPFANSPLSNACNQRRIRRRIRLRRVSSVTLDFHFATCGNIWMGFANG